jgi:hypothetical protein
LLKLERSRVSSSETLKAVTERIHSALDTANREQAFEASGKAIKTTKHKSK